MIRGMDCQSPAICVLSESPEVFYLTGSRFFGTEAEFSDYDFFVQRAAMGTSERHLVRNGFRLDSDTRYSDKVYIRDNVHVQIVGNAPLKNRIQDLMKRMLPKEDLRLLLTDKVRARRLWSLFNSLVMVDPTKPERAW
jgi:hypothetical protein